MEETPRLKIMTYFRLQGRFVTGDKTLVRVRVSGENVFSLHAPAGATGRISLVPGRV